MKQLLKKLMNLFSLGGSNTVDLEEKNRTKKYVSYILLREPHHKILEYHYLFLGEDGEPNKVSIQRYYKDYIDGSNSKLRSEISSQLYSIEEYMELYFLSLNEVKAIFSYRSDLYTYNYSYVKDKSILTYMHDFKGIDVKFTYSFDKSKSGLDAILVKEIKRVS